MDVLHLIHIYLQGRLYGVNAPQSCLPRYARNDLEIIPGYLRDLGEEIGDEELVENMKQKCAYEGTFFENGNRWEATHEKCQVCRYVCVVVYLHNIY